MDTTDQYIKMCEKATEIKGVWDIKCGDYVVVDKYKDRRLALITERTSQDFAIVAFPYASPPNRDMHRIENMIPLPRQDQLQEMREGLEINSHVPYKQLLSVCEWLCQQGLPPLRPMSMEMIWLAFVMHTKYNKAWDGENWISSE